MNKFINNFINNLPLYINGFVAGKLIFLAGISWTTGILWFLLMISFFWYGKIEYNRGKNKT